MFHIKETKGMISPLFNIEYSTLKQTLNRACPMAQRLAWSVEELTETLQSHPLGKTKCHDWS